MDLPHARGDEPYINTENLTDYGIYPTHVGMNQTELRK